MRYQKKQWKKPGYNWRRRMAVMLIFCLLLTNLNFGSLLAYATEDAPVIFEIGADVTATLAGGVLTLSGYGDTDDFEKDTAPFSEYADDIHTLEIEDGITYIGDYLFYGLGELKGELRLPGSIAGFGDYAFSGDSLKDAPKFTAIYNEFVDSEIVVRDDLDGDLKDDRPESEGGQAGTHPAPDAADQTKESEEGTKAEGETESEAGKETEAAKETEAGKETETAKETEAGKETETAKETEAGKETETAKETEAGKETGAAKETEAGKDTETAKETEAGKDTETAKETEAVKETEAAKGTEAAKETKPVKETETAKETRPAKETETVKESKPVKETEAVKVTKPAEEPELMKRTEALGRSAHRVSVVWAAEDYADDKGDPSSGSAYGNDSSSQEASSGNGDADTSSDNREESGNKEDASADTSDKDVPDIPSGQGGNPDKNDAPENGEVTGKDDGKDAGDSYVENPDSVTEDSQKENTETDAGHKTEDQLPPADQEKDENPPAEDVTLPSEDANLPSEDKNPSSGGGNSSSEGGNSSSEGGNSSSEGGNSSSGDGNSPVGGGNSSSEGGISSSGGGSGKNESPQPDKNDTENAEDEEPLISYITEQQITTPENLFYEGQSGYFLCSENNLAFIESAESAGYELADRIVTAVIDDGEAELELPVLEDMLLLPECPDTITGPNMDDLFFTSAFDGWLVENGEEESIWKAGEYLDIHGKEVVFLYSAWKTAEQHPLAVEVKREGGVAAYTLIDSETGMEPDAPARYAFLYQWQVSEASPSNAIDWATPSDAIEEEATASNAKTAGVRGAYKTATSSDAERALDEEQGWTDIDGADEPVYERTIEERDSKLQFRCKVTAVSLLRSSAPGVDVVMYSEPRAGTVPAMTVYVNQTSGADTNEGTREAPLKSLKAAAVKLQSNTGGDVESNRVILLDDYHLTTEDLTTDKNDLEWFAGIAVPATVAGEKSGGGSVTLQGLTVYEAGIEVLNSFTLCSDLTFESLTLKQLGHIYCDGHNFTSGKGITTSSAPYLYGSGNSKMSPTMGNTIRIKSGVYGRIAGYIRSGQVDANNKEVTIRIEEDGVVDKIIAGSASGGISNANVTIEVSGGNVATLTGGCQGFSANESIYKGTTKIMISGGTVAKLYGAGTGRDVSAPQFIGTLDIQISGGTVKDAIYASGSAARIVSNDDVRSKVDITVSGGTVKDIYAAGRGGDDAVYQYKTTSGTTILNSNDAKDFGSLQGDAVITVKENATVTGNVYASGEGYVYAGSDRNQYGHKNAYLDGTCKILVQGGTVKGSIFGGGKGIDQDGYADCARVTESSKVTIEMTGGTVEGDVYGGGQTACTYGSTSVDIKNGTINGNVYGGAYGKLGSVNVYGSSTVNMTGGWIRGNLYGGSNLSDTGEKIPDEGTEEYKAKADLYEKHNSGLVFVNLVGGVVDGKVFGGGNQGIVNGSTHLHIGTHAIEKCKHYSNPLYSADSPGALEPAVDLIVGGSVYAGGDYGDGQDYNKITVTGYSHVYIDGTGYRFRADGNGNKLMEFSGGVFGSGASCDAGSVRLVTLDNFGSRITDDQGKTVGTYGKIKSIQRADQVRLIQSHVQLIGQSDIANEDETALYSLNRIGDTTKQQDIGELGVLGNSLVLKDGSTLMLDSETIKIANYKSVDGNDVPVELTTDGAELPVNNTILFTSGTTLHVSYTDAASEVQYGAVSGYTYMEILNQAEAYIYARTEPEPDSPVDGGFAAYGEKEADGRLKTITPIVVSAENYRYWKMADAGSVSKRQTVLTARRNNNAGAGEYLVASGTIELPPTGDGSAEYRITRITLSPNAVFVDAAIDPKGEWKYASTVDTPDKQQAEQNKIKENPLKTFGFYMHPAKGFDESTQNTPMVVSESTIGNITAQPSVSLTNATPQVEFYLTYYNDGITVSQDLGSVEIEAVRTDTATGTKDTIVLQIDLVTKSSELNAQTIDLYATQSGSFTGNWIIPAGADRKMSLVKTVVQDGDLVDQTTALSGNQFAVAMQPQKDLGWKTNDLMTSPHYLKAATSQNILLGSTDNRYEAKVGFTMYNAGGFAQKAEPDTVVLTFEATDSSSTVTTVDITLKIHWGESIVSEVYAASGKYYDSFPGESGIRISGESSVTAAFKIGKGSDPVSLWLELQNKDNSTVSLPAGTRLTLINSGNPNFYIYEVKGTGTDDRIPLTDFRQMWTQTVLSGNISQDSVLTVIVDLDNDSFLSPGEYSLHLRDNTSADTAKAHFTVDNTLVSVTLAGGSSLQEPKSEYPLTLTVNAGNDTRLSKGTAAVFTLDDGRNFPEGTVFTHNGSTYAPMNGKVYIVLDSGVASHQIVMDTRSSSGLEEGAHYLTAKILSVGLNAGNKVISSDKKVTYTVKAVPVYALKVESGDSRGVTAGSTVKFQVAYSFENVGIDEQVIGVLAREKKDGSYGEGVSWTTDGNHAIRPVSGGASGEQTIKVTVPRDAGPGTYRLVFTLGDKSAFYNVIVVPDK